MSTISFTKICNHRQSHPGTVISQYLLIFTFIIIAIACGNQSHKSITKEIGPTPILLFNGTGISPNDVTAIGAILDNNHLKYATVNSSELNSVTLSQLKSHRLLIIPGGNFIDMGKSLSPATAANIRDAVQGGLNYLGICAGGFLAGSSSYYNGFNLTSGVTFGFYPAVKQGVRKAALAISHPDGKVLEQFWEDGPQLTGWGTVLANYPDGTPAVVQGKCGEGLVILTGIHAEAPADWRGDMVFHTSADADNAYAVTLIKAALNGTLLQHY